MACILKIPSKNTKGVVTFTTQERDKFILTDKLLQDRIMNLKERWVIGLHHNWHDFNFQYNPLFDFSMAGESDLIEKDGKNVPLVPLDACNFSPSEFYFTQDEKFWDILYVARAVFFKKIPEFFQVIRKLYDQGKMYRVLLICPIPDECKTNPKSKTAFCDVRKIYDEMFTQKEQSLFTLLTIDYRTPFPFDIPTLAHFYRSSKIFVHSADDERRCRVAGYAWAAGLPVVCMDAAASLLSLDSQRKPNVYIAKSYADFPSLIDEALLFFNSENYNEVSMTGSIQETSEMFTKITLMQKLEKYSNNTSSIDESNSYNLNNLDIRLGRHHGFGETVNSVGWSINSLVNYLKDQPSELLIEDTQHIDPERYILKYNQFGNYAPNSLYSGSHLFRFVRIKSILVRYFPFLLKLKYKYGLGKR